MRGPKSFTALSQSIFRLASLEIGCASRSGSAQLGIDGVRMRIVRVPDDVLAFEIIDYVLESALIAVAGDHALAHEIVGGM